jgi:hypothetical protein
MSITSKSPASVLRVELDIAKQVYPAYSRRYSPEKSTQYQLLACLVLKNSLKTDYRGVTEPLQDCHSLQKILGLKHVPHFTTLQKAAHRLLASASARCHGSQATGTSATSADGGH